MKKKLLLASSIFSATILGNIGVYGEDLIIDTDFTFDNINQINDLVRYQNINISGSSTRVTINVDNNELNFTNTFNLEGNDIALALYNNHSTNNLPGIFNLRYPSQVNLFSKNSTNNLSGTFNFNTSDNFYYILHQ